MIATFVKSEETAKNIRTFWFELPNKPKYIAGQFIELHLPHENKDKRGDKRWFTLSSSPTEEYVSVTTKFAEENGSSFKNALKELRPGDQVSMSMPMGDFVLPKDSSLPLVFIAGGIGCTPFRSIAKYLQDSSGCRDIHMMYAARSENEIAFANLFEGFTNFEKIIGERLNAQKILENIPEPNERYFYLSGPEPMIESLVEDMKKAGINKKHIHTDYFPNYTKI